ncbi:PVC-type heme-binding CxxCH protein [Lignipirellula cremea]|uniref:HEAT repeat protein n=1 Tax=Lignipirellula cremea TaxID=2528010 RepID=A0A518DZA5_9BACT|nr:PVC-type heme-binding CxxCH protein [Lignipirellula cremea]QDU97180.1 HEAT repeat protein [Lignipirellula cremea]
MTASCHSTTGRLATCFLPMAPHTASVFALLLLLVTRGEPAPLQAAEGDFTPAPLTAPVGYAIERAASPPLVAHPLMGALDPQGRLYVAATAGENLRRPDLEEQLPNFVQRLEDVDGDGVFDKATIFADKMTFPQGCLWYRGSLYVASSGAIWKLTDDDDDGVADRREKLVDGFNYGGNAADVHGCFLGPEGRIYWCDGRWGHELKDDQGQIVSQGKAAHIFSCRPDGSHVRSHATGGMDNPVEIVFTPTGDMLGTVNLMYSQPRGDCLVHWQYGGVYPREDFASTLDSELLRTGDLLTEVHNFGHVAVSGLCRLESNSWGPGAVGDLLVTVFNTNRIVRVKLKPAGSTYQVDQLEDFLVSSSRDFHPTDVLEDADGSVLVIDTGGWFRIGCPQSQIAKSDIHGAIYRIRKTGAVRPADPRGLTIDWPALDDQRLLALLGDERPAVVVRARERLADRLVGKVGAGLAKTMLALWDQQSPAVQQRYLQLAALPETPFSAAIFLAGLGHSNAGVRQMACRCLYDKGTEDPQAINALLIERLKDASPAVRREAAAALGQRTIGEKSPVERREIVETLLAALPANVDDPLVRHALVYALIDAGEREATSAGLLSPHQAVRTAAAIALEQMRQKTSRPDKPLLKFPAPAIGAPLTEAEQNQVLQRLEGLPQGEADRGKALFYHEKSACSKCHRVGSQGGQVGPDLTTIGRIRGGQDLLASMMFPSASFARGFESYTVETVQGQRKSGILLGENGREIRLGLDKDHAVAIPIDQIDQIVPSPLSIMPPDVAKQLSDQELADLLAWLLLQK